jgi:hypothetical protein
VPAAAIVFSSTFATAIDESVPLATAETLEFAALKTLEQDATTVTESVFSNVAVVVAAAPPVNEVVPSAVAVKVTAAAVVWLVIARKPDELTAVT